MPCKTYTAWMTFLKYLTPIYNCLLYNIKYYSSLVLQIVKSYTPPSSLLYFVLFLLFSLISLISTSLALFHRFFECPLDLFPISFHLTVALRYFEFGLFITYSCVKLKMISLPHFYLFIRSFYSINQFLLTKNTMFCILNSVH